MIQTCRHILMDISLREETVSGEAKTRVEKVVLLYGVVRMFFDLSIYLLYTITPIQLLLSHTSPFPNYMLL